MMHKSSFLRIDFSWRLSFFQKFILVTVFFLPAAYFIVMLNILQMDSKLFWRLLKEDGKLEYLQALSYLISGFVATAMGWKALRFDRMLLSTLYFMLALGLFFVSMEEISWGQRIFGFNTPEIILNRNTQEEFSLHNIDIVQNYLLHQSYVIIGVAAAVLWVFIPKSLFAKWSGFFSFIIPTPITMLYFLPVGLYYAYCELEIRYLLPKIIGLESQELFETPFALGFFAFTSLNYFRFKNAIEQKREGSSVSFIKKANNSQK